MNDFRDDRSVGSLLKELSSGTSTLFREEVALAKTEASQKIAFLQENGRKLAIGGGLLIVGLVLLLMAANRGLTALLENWMSLEIAVWLAPLILGLPLTLVGLGFVRGALRRVGTEPLKPEQTIESLQEDKQWLTAKVK